MSPLLTRLEASKYLQIDRKTLRVWELNRKGPDVIKMPSGHSRYLLADIEKWLHSQRTKMEPNKAEKNDSV